MGWGGEGVTPNPIGDPRPNGDPIGDPIDPLGTPNPIGAERPQNEEGS